MNELIPIVGRAIAGQTVETVSARDLHEFLQVGRDFSNWIKDRIQLYAFVEEWDFVIVEEFGSPNSASQTGRGGNRLQVKEYHLTLDMAKELSMVERNEKGKQARQYFIACERRSKSGADPMKVLNDPAAMRGLLLTYSEKVIALESQVTKERGRADGAETEARAAKPAVTALARIADAEGSLNLTDAAKALQVPPKTFASWLMQNGWIYRRAGNGHYLGYQARVVSGDLTHKVTRAAILSTVSFDARREHLGYTAASQGG